MIPINITIARSDLRDSGNIGYSGVSLMLPATRYEIQDAHDIILSGDCAKYKAILQTYGTRSLTDAVKFADTISDYEYYPEAFCAEDYGWEIFLKNHNIKLDDAAMKRSWFGNYGFTLIDEHNAVKTEYGFIRKAAEQAQSDEISHGIGGIS